MQLLRAADYRRMPWKNGGGETLEIAVSPAGATLDAMDWRISMAIVATDGPFSSFPGVDRTLSIVEGAGMALDVGSGRHIVTPDTAPLQFPADIPTTAKLLGGTVTDLNVMTRRGRYRHTVRRVIVQGTQSVDVSADEVAVLCCAGKITCRTQIETTELQDKDCMMLRAPAGSLALTSQVRTVVLVAEIFPAII